MNFKKLCVFDFETDGKDSSTCNPVQLAALMIEPRNLEIIKDSEFVIDIRPPEIDKPEYFTNEINECIAWHAKNYKVTSDQIIEKWKKAVSIDVAWASFVTYLGRFNAKKSWFTAPIACGANIRNFDLPIINRLEEKFKTPKVFWPRDKIDLLDLSFLWFENLAEPTNYNMDQLRPFFGLEDGGHDALKDVRDTATLIQKFLRLHRSYSHKIKFKGSCGKKGGDLTVSVPEEVG